MWFFAIFLPPVFLVMRKRPVAAICNFLLLLAGLFLIPVFGLGLILIFIAIIQSAMEYRKKEIDGFVNKQADATARAMAQQMKSQKD